MGASVFTNWEAGKDPDAAFFSLKDREIMQYGFAGYSGRIVEKEDFEIIPQEEFIESGLTLDEFIDEMLDDPRFDDKWGPAAALAYTRNGVDGWLFFGWASS